MKRYRVFIFLSFFYTLSLQAQNIIYQKGNQRVYGQLVEFDNKKIKFITGKDRASSPRQRLNIEDVVLIFNTTGDYLVFNRGAMFSQAEGDEFIHQTEITRTNDILVNKKGEIFTARVLYDNPDSVAYAINGIETRVATGTLVAIIYKSGLHKLFVSAETAILYLTEEKKATIAQLLKKPEEQPLKPKPAATPPPAPATAAATAQVETASPGNGPGGPKFNPEFFKKRSMEKINFFERCLKIIMDPKTPAKQSSNYVSLGNELFLPDSRIEISSLNNKVKKDVTILQYLNSLQANASHFSDVKVEFASVHYATNFSPNADGSWSAVVTVVQKYAAAIDGKITYSDETSKNISITVKKYKKAEEKGFTEQWEVYLGNISVLQTQRL